MRRRSGTADIIRSPFESGADTTVAVGRCADVVTFETFLLDCASGELRRGDSTIELRPKVYALLVYLVENRGRLIPKTELIEAVWGNIHVGDGSLNRAIAELRRALADDSRNPRLIETVPRRGYKFIGPVTESAAMARHVSHFMLIYLNAQMPLFLGENIVGRTPECDVQIIAPSVSRRHARIVVSGDGALLEDLGSLNGTFVGERRIRDATALREGDEIGIGKERALLLSNRKLRARTEPAV